MADEAYKMVSVPKKSSNAGRRRVKSRLSFSFSGKM